IDSFIDDFHNNYEDYYTNIVRYTYFYIFECPMKFPTMPKNFELGNFNLFDLTKEQLKLPEKLIKILI
ncbi:MAG: hypothetical protein ACFFBF_16985, partial [Promethearchaeota archaeon]